MDALNKLTERIIKCAIEVHRQLGPGLLEAALCIEFDDVGLKYLRQLPVQAVYKGRTIGEYRLDLLLENLVVIELKSVERFDPVFDKQVLTYLRIAGKKLGLLINLNSHLLSRGIRRLIL